MVSCASTASARQSTVAISVPRPFSDPISSQKKSITHPLPYISVASEPTRAAASIARGPNWRNPEGCRSSRAQSRRRCVAVSRLLSRAKIPRQSPAIRTCARQLPAFPIPSRASDLNGLAELGRRDRQTESRSGRAFAPSHCESGRSAGRSSRPQDFRMRAQRVLDRFLPALIYRPIASQKNRQRRSQVDPEFDQRVCNRSAYRLSGPSTHCAPRFVR